MPCNSRRVRAADSTKSPCAAVRSKHSRERSNLLSSAALGRFGVYRSREVKNDDLEAPPPRCYLSSPTRLMWTPGLNSAKPYHKLLNTG